MYVCVCMCMRVCTCVCVHLYQNIYNRSHLPNIVEMDYQNGRSVVAMHADINTYCMGNLFNGPFSSLNLCML